MSVTHGESHPQGFVLQTVTITWGICPPGAKMRGKSVPAHHTQITQSPLGTFVEKDEDEEEEEEAEELPSLYHAQLNATSSRELSPHQSFPCS